MKIKTYLLIFPLMIGVSVTGYAASYNQATEIQQNQKSPDILLEEGINNIVGFLRQSGAQDLNKILFFINENIASYFDFTYMTQLSAGRYRRDLTEAQMNKLSNKIQTMFIESLSSKLVDYAFTNRKIRFLPPQRTKFGNEVTVRAIVTHPRGYPSRISFKFHPTKNGWKIYDLSANGQSAVLHYRSMISRIVARKGIQALTQ